MLSSLKKNISATSSALDNADTKELVLSVELGINKFCFTIVNQSTQELLLLADYEAAFGNSFGDNLAAMRPVFEEHGLSSKYFPNKRIILNNKRFALLPEILWDKNEIAPCLQILHGDPDEKSEEFTDVLPNSMYNVYDFPVTLLQAIRIIFPSAIFLHHISAFLMYAKKFAKENTTLAVVEVCENSFYLAIFDNQQLLFCNTFEYKSKEDFIYFILSVFIQLKIDVQTVETLFTGKITEDSQLFSISYKYIKDVSLITEPVCNTQLNVLANHFPSLLNLA